MIDLRRGPFLLLSAAGLVGCAAQRGATRPEQDPSDGHAQEHERASPEETSIADERSGRENEPAHATEAFRLQPGVIFHENATAIYVMSPDHAIDAIHPGTGDVLWRSTIGERPLAVSGRYLVAQAGPDPAEHGLRLVTLDTERAGSVVARCDPVAIPGWARGSIDDGLGDRFSAVGLEHDGTVYVRWDASSRVVTGVATNRPGNHASGFVSVDPRTGDVRGVRSAAFPEWPHEQRSLVPAGWLTDWEVGPLAVGDVEATVVGVTTGNTKRIELRRRRRGGGSSLPHVVLESTPLVQVRRGGRTVSVHRYPLAHVLSVDHAHSLAARYLTADTVAYEWSLFSIESGRRVGHFTHEDVLPPAFLVRGDRAIVMWSNKIPPHLRGLRLPTGEVVWEYVLRNTRYAGPYPPGRRPPGRPAPPLVEER